jgi:hypothetical protein
MTVRDTAIVPVDLAEVEVVLVALIQAKNTLENVKGEGLDGFDKTLEAIKTVEAKWRKLAGSFIGGGAWRSKDNG